MSWLPRERETPTLTYDGRKPEGAFLSFAGPDGKPYAIDRRSWTDLSDRIAAIEKRLGAPDAEPFMLNMSSTEAQRPDGVVPMPPPENDAWRQMMRGTLWGVAIGTVALLGLLIAMLVTL